MAFDIAQDEEFSSLKKRAMGGVKWNSLLHSINDVSKFVAAPLFMMGASALILGGATLTLGAILVGASAALMAVAVGAAYITSNMEQSSSFDRYELSAQRTARHLVEQLKANNIVLAEEHTQNARADGKKWVEAVGKDQETVRAQG